MAHRFLVQIVEVTTGEVLRFPGGSPLEADFLDACAQAIVDRGVGFGRTERDFIEACVTAVLKRKVGFLRTEAHVAQAVRDGLRDALISQPDTPVAQVAIREGLTDALLRVKRQARPFA